MFLFGKKKKEAAGEPKLHAPLTGECMPIDKVPDPVFADKILGDGVAVLPTDGTVVAPCDGEITNVAETLHAYGIQTPDGLELLIHVGLNTVELKGEGFTPLVKVGDKVKMGTPLCKVDLEFIKSKGYPLYTPLLITNSDELKSMTGHYGAVTAGETVAVEYVK